MHRRSHQEDWERRKSYLIRSLSANTQVLSPIYERSERLASDDSDTSFLPDLIVEKQRHTRYIYEDETEEFYDKLYDRMKKFYRKLFLGEDIDIDDDVIGYSSSNDCAERNVYEASGIVPAEDESTYKIPSEGDYETAEYEAEKSDNDNWTAFVRGDKSDVTESKASQESSSAASAVEQVSGESDKTYKLTEYGEEQSTTDQDSEERLAEIEGKTFSRPSSVEDEMEVVGCRMPISQTFTEKPGDLEDSISTRSEESNGAGVITVTEKAMIHAGNEPHNLEASRRHELLAKPHELTIDLKDSLQRNIRRFSMGKAGDRNIEEREIELMRHECTTLNESFIVPRLEKPKESPQLEVKARSFFASKEIELEPETPPTQHDSLILNDSISSKSSPLLNVARFSLLEIGQSKSIPSSMEIDDFFLHPPQPQNVSTPKSNVSPVLAVKRQATESVAEVVPKKKKQETHDISKRNKETETSRIVLKETGTETEINQADKEMQTEIEDINKDERLNVAVQTDMNVRDAATEISVNTREVYVQANCGPEWISCRNLSTQTDNRDSRDEATQTKRTLFEHLRFCDGVNFFFIF